MVSTNPYVGPAAIPEGMPLHGRDDEKRDLYRLLLNERIVLLYSPSGAGKTSLIRAGLLPQLRREPGLRVLLIHGLRSERAVNGPGINNRYVDAVVAQVETALPAGLRGRFDWRSPEASLRAYLDWVRGVGEAGEPRQSDLLVLDHFEDVLLDPRDRQDKQGFFRELGHALTDRSRHALFSMGERHIAELDEYLHLVPTGLTRRFRLGLLGRRQARQAIMGPAAQRDVRYESRAVARLMLELRATADPRAAAGRAGLSEWVEPLHLQVLCQRLWDKRYPSGPQAASVIGAADVEAFSVESALEAYYADSAKAAARAGAVEERDVREWIEGRLILPSGARGQALRADTAGPALPEAATAELENAHLLSLQMLGNSRWHELSHDRLVEPIRRDNRRWFEQNLAPLQHRAREWVRSKSADRLLLSVPEFARALRWRRAHDAELRPEERDFWQRSRRSLLLARVAPAVGSLLLVVVGAIALWLIQERNAERSALEQQQMLLTLGHAKELALERSLDAALIEGARAASDVGARAAGPVRERLEFSVRDSLITILRATGKLHRLIVHDDMRLKTVALQRGSADHRFAYGGTGGKVMFADSDGALADVADVGCAKGSNLSSLAFNRLGTLLATGCEDGTVAVWSTSRWQRVAAWKAHTGRTIAVTFDPHGSEVVSGGEGRGAALALMPLGADGSATRVTPRALEVKAVDGIWAVAYSPKQDSLVAADGAGKVWLCDLATSGKCELKRELGEDDAVIAVAFSPDGACVATGSWKGRVSLWDNALSSSSELPNESKPALSLAFTERRGDTELAIGRATRLRYVRLDARSCTFDPSTAGVPVSGPPLVGDEVTGLAFDEDRKILAATTAVGYLALLDVENPRERVRTAPMQVPPIAVEGKGLGWRGALISDDSEVSRLAIGRQTDDRLFIVRIDKTGQSRVEDSVATGQGGVARVTASTAGRRAATLGKDGSVAFWNANGSALTRDPKLSASADACRLAVEAAPQQGQVAPGASAPNAIRQSPSRILLSPKGDLLACLFEGRRGVRVIDLAGQLPPQWIATEQMTKAPLEIAFSADGTTFAAGGDKILLWDVIARKLKPRAIERPIQMTRLANLVAELALATDRDGRSLVIAGAANGQLLVWDASTGELLKTLRHDSRQVEQMAFLPSKGLLAAADAFGRVVVWDTGDWLPLALGDRSDLNQKTRFLSFSLQGRLLVSGTDDLMSWDLDPDSLRHKVCDILGTGSGSRSVSERVADACGVTPSKD